MAKSTRSQQVQTGTSDSYTAEELNDPAPPVRITRAMLGVVPTEEVKSSAGGDSMQSSESAPTSSETTTRSDQAPAPTMENLSGKTGQADSGADSTGGDGLETLSPSDKEIITPPAKNKARSTTLDDDDFAALQ